jgi:hypothetical protein
MRISEMELEANDRTSVGKYVPIIKLVNAVHLGGPDTTSTHNPP